MFNSHKILCFCLTLLALWAPTAPTAIAATVTTDENGYASSIEGLEVDFDFYNVQFRFGSWGFVYGTEEGFFPFPEDSAKSEEATNAIADVLNQNSIEQVVDPITNQSFNVAAVPYNILRGAGLLDAELWVTLTNGDAWNAADEGQLDSDTLYMYATFVKEERPPGNLDDTWYRGNISSKLTRGWLTKNDGTLVQVRPSLQYFFKVCDAGAASDCAGTRYNVVIAIADFDGDGVFEADEVFNISLETCGPDETSFVAEVDIADKLDLDGDPSTSEVFNQSVNGLMVGSSNNVGRSRGCVWTADFAPTTLDPDVIGRKCKFNIIPTPEENLPFTEQDLVDQGVIEDVGDLDCSSTSPPSDDVVQVFITGQSFIPTNFGGLAGADAKCQERAETAGLTGTWTAWLSDSTGNAIDRIPDGEYRLLDGTIIADDKADLTFGRLKAPINVNERGEPLTGLAWTGTSPDGTNTGTNCSDWTQATTPGTGGCTAGDDDCGDRGFSEAINSDWTQITPSPIACNQAFHLYCFGSGE